MDLPGGAVASGKVAGGENYSPNPRQSMTFKKSPDFFARSMAIGVGISLRGPFNTDVKNGHANVST